MEAKRKNDLDKEIGRRIRELREEKHYTREKFSEKVNISTKFLYEIESGKKSFTVAVLSKIAQELSVTCDYIVIGEQTNLDENYELLCILESFDANQTAQIKRLIEAMKKIYEVL